jgi:hypothetical protein
MQRVDTAESGRKHRPATEDSRSCVTTTSLKLIWYVAALFVPILL